MMVRKFYADSPREALRLVRDALGPNAMILSNRRTAAGVEIAAVSESEIASVTGGMAMHAMTAPKPERRPAEVNVRAPVAPPPTPPPSPVEPPAYNLVQEVRILRSMLEGQLAAFAWHGMADREPAKIEVLRRLLAAGFSTGSARQCVERIAPGLDSARALRLIKMRLQQQLPIVPAGQTPVELGGVYALVGPTGVGKTTTVAKIAAECTLKLGAQRVALVTIDSYRIGAVDQLRIYGKILGAPVFALKTEADLVLTLSELRMRHLVLIDTVGMSQRDQRITDQIALLAGNGKRVKRLLLLSAVAQANVLEDVVRAYRGDGLTGCILTKVDESLTLGGALDVLLRHKLPLHYVTNGQRVPEDLHRPNPLYLVERAFRAVSESGAQSPAEADYPLIYAAGAGAEMALAGGSSV
jgi:flagellar biosynthesis protein FlhF